LKSFICQALEWYKEGACGGGFYKLQVDLMDADGKVSKMYIFKDMSCWQPLTVI